MTTALARLFAEIVQEAKSNPEFRKRLEQALNTKATAERSSDRGGIRRSRNRREPGVLDPYAEFARGEDHLRTSLSVLTVEQLKNIVSEHALDSSRLALKWQSADRLIDLILTTVRSRLEKGDAFRT